MLLLPVLQRTVADIQAKYGGGSLGAYKGFVFTEYLKDHNEGEELEAAVDRFVRSCAG